MKILVMLLAFTFGAVDCRAAGVLINGNQINSASQITISSETVTGNAFSVGGSTFVVTVGKVGIGTTNPVAALDSSGTIRASYYAPPTSGHGLEINYGGSFSGGQISSYDRSLSAYDGHAP